MGLRSRLKGAIKDAIGRGPEQRPPAPPPPAATPIRATPLPPPKLEPAAIVEPPPAPPVPGVVAEEAPAPAHPSPDISRQGTETASDDAPVRNAHYRETFETTAAAHRITLHHREFGTTIEFPCEPGEFILDAADRAGTELPFSCRSGGCLSCTGKVLQGEGEMGEQYVLEPEHLARGYYLLCCTTPRTDCVVVSHQEDEVT